MGRQKNFLSTNFGEKHPRPIRKSSERDTDKNNSVVNSSELSPVNTRPKTSTGTDNVSARASDVNTLLLSELKHLSTKMDSMEKRLAATELKLQSPVRRESTSGHQSSQKCLAVSTPDGSSDSDTSDFYTANSKNKAHNAWKY